MNKTGYIHQKAAIYSQFDIPASDLQKSFLREQIPFMIIRLSDASPPKDLPPPVIQDLSISFLQRVRNHLPAVEVCPGASGTIYRK